MKATQAAGDNLDLTKMTMHPCVVPDRGVSEQTMTAALAMLNELVARKGSVKQKPRSKFW
jgi:hypothetical protein